MEEVFRANGAREGGGKPKAKAEAKQSGKGGGEMDEVIQAKGQQASSHGGGGGEGGEGDIEDSAVDSDIEEDLGNDSPVKVITCPNQYTLLSIHPINTPLSIHCSNTLYSQHTLSISTPLPSLIS